MSKRQAVTAAPGLLEVYAQHFDELFSKRNQREGFRNYLIGLLLPSERNKTLTNLANTEPIVGAQDARAQTLQWYVSESTWDANVINQRHLDILMNLPELAPHEGGVLAIDETGDRKAGRKTAHVGRQYLANVGKIDNGVVSVTSLWADHEVYYPVDSEPYTPASHFEGGKSHPAFRTKLKIALDLVAQSVARKIPFRAVVADNFYGEDRGFRQGLEYLKVGYVLALKPSFSWWHKVGTIGSLEGAALTAGWVSSEQPGTWVTFRDGHTELWWALDVQAGPFGAGRTLRGIVVTTSPSTLPPLTTWYLITNLPAPNTPQASTSELLPASLVELVYLYGLRTWIEQSYKQVKHSLGWAQYQVRSDKAIRRHWALVCCAFTFCWWQAFVDQNSLLNLTVPTSMQPSSMPTTTQAQDKKSVTSAAVSAVLAFPATSSQSLARPLHFAQALLAGILSSAPATCITNPS